MINPSPSFYNNPGNNIYPIDPNESTNNIDPIDSNESTNNPDPLSNGGIVQDPGEPEHFSNMNVDLDKVLKAVFFGAIFYLLSQPEVYKMSKKCLGKVDGVLVHSVVFAVLYLILNMFI